MGIFQQLGWQQWWVDSKTMLLLCGETKLDKLDIRKRWRTANWCECFKHHHNNRKPKKSQWGENVANVHKDHPSKHIKFPPRGPWKCNAAAASKQLFVMKWFFKLMLLIQVCFAWLTTRHRLFLYSVFRILQTSSSKTLKLVWDCAISFINTSARCVFVFELHVCDCAAVFKSWPKAHPASTPAQVAWTFGWMCLWLSWSHQGKGSARMRVLTLISEYLVLQNSGWEGSLVWENVQCFE